MARLKHYVLNQTKMIPLSYADQIVEGSFEYALNEIVEEHLDLAVSFPGPTELRLLSLTGKESPGRCSRVMRGQALGIGQIGYIVNSSRPS